MFEELRDPYLNGSNQPPVFPPAIEREATFTTAETGGAINPSDVFVNTTHTAEAERARSRVTPDATVQTASSTRAEEAAESAERHCIDLAATLHLSSYDQQYEVELPYNAALIARLLRCFFSSKKSKLPRFMLRFIATACRFKRGRGPLLRAYFASFTSANGSPDLLTLRTSMEAIHESSISHLSDGISKAHLESELNCLCEELTNSLSNPLHLRRLLTGLNYLLRKTDRIVWFEVLSRDYNLDPSSSGGICLFDFLLDLLGRKENITSITLDLIMMAIEELCNPYGSLTVKEATYLSTYASKFRAEQDQDSNRDNKELHPRKRLRINDVPEIIGESSVSAEEMDVPTEESVSVSSEVVSANPAVPPGRIEKKLPGGILLQAKKAKVSYPFVVLRSRECRLLCDVVGSVECGGSTRKRLMRIMRNLSLADCNWYLFLESLTSVASVLVDITASTFTSLHQALTDIANQEVTQEGRSRKRSSSSVDLSSMTTSSSGERDGNGFDVKIAKAMSLPQIAAPSSIPEVRLLNVLKTMTLLRSRAGVSAVEEAEVISTYMRRLGGFATPLWDALCNCLQIVRDLEGIHVESTDGTTAPMESSSGISITFTPRKKDDKKLKQGEEEARMSPSALTLRFIPLIECYLIVSSTTLLIRPSLPPIDTAVATTTSSAATPKRKLTSEDGEPAVSTGGAFTPIPLTRSTSLSIPAPVEHPGSKFRKNTDYLSMQMEFIEFNVDSIRLLGFVEHNRILLNMILRHNVQLLDTSFSLLVTHPKCRQVLHFDIKRAYFKMKLKKKRITATRSASSSGGSLRITVHRQRVFEDSYQALRYKTPDEMRKKLSVTFSGEEGMDAGSQC